MIIQRKEELILNQLLYNDEYFRKVYPHLDKKYFQERIEFILFEVIQEHTKKYGSPPSITTLSIAINEKRGITAEEINSLNEYIGELLNEPAEIEESNDTIIDQTEDFCKERAMYNAIIDAMGIVSGEDKTRTQEAIPDIMRDALKVSFNNSIGLDYDNAEEKYERLHREQNKIPFDVEAFNIITKGGLANKTLNCVLASTGVGKTILMCHVAAAAITQGKNVLYITMEMAEEKIAERIDANLMDVELDDFDHMEKDKYMTLWEKVKRGGSFLRRFFGLRASRDLGKLIIKEYPTGAGNANHFRFLLDELELKKAFKPDLIVVDYINICSSTRILPMAGSYTFVKAIAEELRGLAVEYDIPVFTGTQTNRGGFSNNDVEMTDTSESIGLPQTLDLYIAAMTNDIMEKSGRLAFKILKNRYRDMNKNKYFTVGLDKSKMRFFHVDDWCNAIGENDDLSVAEIISKKEDEERFGGINL